MSRIKVGFVGKPWHGAVVIDAVAMSFDKAGKWLSSPAYRKGAVVLVIHEGQHYLVSKEREDAQNAAR